MEGNKFLSCDDCIYLERMGIVEGICRKNAPINSKFSIIEYNNDWCGDFQKKIKCYDCEYSEYFEKNKVICKKYNGFPIVDLKDEHNGEQELLCKIRKEKG